MEWSAVEWPAVEWAAVERQQKEQQHRCHRFVLTGTRLHDIREKEENHHRPRQHGKILKQCARDKEERERRKK